MEEQEVSELIRARMDARGWKPSEFARRARVSRSTVCRWLSGERKPDRKNIPRVAELLGVQAEQLL